MKARANTICKDSEHHFVELTHHMGGSECHCCICGLKVSFNRGWPERIDPEEMEAFWVKYKGSTASFDNSTHS